MSGLYSKATGSSSIINSNKASTISAHTTTPVIGTITTPSVSQNILNKVLYNHKKENNYYQYH